MVLRRQRDAGRLRCQRERYRRYRADPGRVPDRMEQDVLSDSGRSDDDAALRDAYGPPLARLRRDQQGAARASAYRARRLAAPGGKLGRASVGGITYAWGRAQALLAAHAWRIPCGLCAGHAQMVEPGEKPARYAWPAGPARLLCFQQYAQHRQPSIRLCP